jgi:hypothetical protein
MIVTADIKGRCEARIAQDVGKWGDSRREVIRSMDRAMAELIAEDLVLGDPQFTPRLEDYAYIHGLFLEGRDASLGTKNAEAARWAQRLAETEGA